MERQRILRIHQAYVFLYFTQMKVTNDSTKPDHFHSLLIYIFHSSFSHQGWDLTCLNLSAWTEVLPTLPQQLWETVLLVYWSLTRSSALHEVNI